MNSAKQLSLSNLSEDEKNARLSKAFLLCYCRSFEHGHSPELHRRLREECDWSLPSERRNIYYDERVR